MLQSKMKHESYSEIPILMILHETLGAEKCEVIRTLTGRTKLQIYTHSKAVICCEIFYLSTIINKKSSISLHLRASNNTRRNMKLPSVVYKKYIMVTIIHQ